MKKDTYEHHQAAEDEDVDAEDDDDDDDDERIFLHGFSLLG